MSMARLPTRVRDNRGLRNGNGGRGKHTNGKTGGKTLAHEDLRW
jgi:hypothetical protein